MLGKTAFVAFACVASVVSLPIRRTPIRREVPQEHSHNAIIASVRTNLAINNPAGIEDPIFGLLGDAAAKAGQGTISDTDCLQQATADQAFTNAKAAGNVTGMVDALIYRALERNTGSVGLASVACTSIQAVNPEIAAVSQHQDPASTNAAATNKAIVLTLAQQIASVGGDPQDALKSGTFAPGNLDDDTGKGNTCDVADDTEGCIFSQNLLVDDATADEIDAAVSGAATGAAATAAVAASTDAASVAVVSSAAATNVAAVSTAAPAAATGAASGANLQTFTGALGGLPPAVTAGGRGFEVAGESESDSDLNVAAALQRSCSIQHNACADAANSGSTVGLTVSQCDAQNTACVAASTGAATGAVASAPAAATNVAIVFAAAPASATAGASGANLQTFTGALGGLPPAVTAGGRGFEVAGESESDSDLNVAAALQRSCSIQHNACADAANSGSTPGLTVSQCDAQNTACVAA